MKQNRITVGMAVLIILIIAAPACHRDCPTCPGPPAESDHLFYVANSGKQFIKTFSAEQRKFIDSINLPIPGFPVGVIDNNEKLAIDDAQGGAYILDLRSREIARTFPNTLEIAVSPDSKHLALLGPGTDAYSYRLYLTDINGSDTIYTDSMVRFANFSNDSRAIAYVHLTQNPSRMELVVYDIDSSKVIDKGWKYYNGLEIVILFWISPSIINGETYFFGSTLLGEFLFAAKFGDDTADAVVRCPGSTGVSFRLNSDDRYLYCALIPGWDDPAYRAIYTVNAVTRGLVDSISTAIYDHQPYEMAITWDDKYMISTPFSDVSNNNMILYDLTTRKSLGAYFITDSTVRTDCPSWAVTKSR
ncbi:exported hypothetical protein [Candidatus Zixiibacteriota bacterium]|nr:exported hypothetical protein [candidate division Zixibacteria bacterium]